MLTRLSEQIIDSFQIIAYKFGVNTEYDSNCVFTFTDIPTGLGCIIEDEISSILARLGIYIFSMGLHPASGQLTIKWQEE